MNFDITLRCIARDDWLAIMRDSRLKDLIGIPIVYYVEDGMFFVWPSPCQIPAFQNKYDLEKAAADILNGVQ